MGPAELALLARLEGQGGRWPAYFEVEHHLTVARYAAHRWGDRAALATYASWPSDRPYKIDPLPELISGAFATLLFGEDPEITPAAESDADNLARIRRASDLEAELWRAQDTSSAEGEIWARLVSRPDLLEAPQIVFSSRRDVVPLFVGPKLVAAAFVTDYLEKASPSDSRPRVRRLFEIHSAGRVTNVLFDGHADNLGQRAPLESFVETAELVEEAVHGLPAMLAWRIRNRVGQSVALGRSDFAGIEDYLFDLNESVAIAAENARLTAKKRAIVSGSLAQGRPDGMPPSVDMGDGSRQPVDPAVSVDLGADVFVADGLDSELGSEGKGPFKVLEYQFDAEALIAHKRDLIRAATTRVGLTPQFVGIYDGSDGTSAESGAALRVRLFPTTGAGRGRIRPWKVALPEILLCAQLLDAAPLDRMGFGRSGWTNAGTPPGVEVAANLPEDETELVNRHAIAVGAEIESRRTAIEALHPDWPAERVDQELEAIREDAKASAASMGLGAFAPGADGGFEDAGSSSSSSSSSSSAGAPAGGAEDAGGDAG